MKLRTRMILAVGTVLFLVLSGAFFFILNSQQRQAEALYRAQAQAVTDCINTVAYTISKHGGVWVAEKNGAKVNPYLAKIPSITPEIEDKNGNKYALMNGFVFVQDMVSTSKGAYSSKIDTKFTYRAPTDKAINPLNNPTPEEQNYLDKMRKENLSEHNTFTVDKNGSPLYVFNRARRTSQEFCVRPCHLDYKVGAIDAMTSIVLPIGKAEAMKQEALRNISYIFLATLLIVSGVLFWIARRITGPIKELAIAASRFSKGETGVAIDIKRHDEIGELAQAFNLMIGEVTRSQEELKQLNVDTVKAFVRAIEAKDPYTRGHSENVAKYAVLLGHELGLSTEQIDELETAALLHDIGKIGVSEDVLNKPGRLAYAEYEHIKSHPNISAQIVGAIPSLASIVSIIKHHHERYDGKGYVDGLAGEQIPFMSRILAIADTFDAMTSDRPYRHACDKEKAFAELRKYAGIQFDAGLVEPFIKAVADLDITQDSSRDDSQGTGSCTAISA